LLNGPLAVQDEQEVVDGVEKGAEIGFADTQGRFHASEFGDVGAHTH
jgi:hypothetical protein